jgi:hypothetical protein
MKYNMKNLLLLVLSVLILESCSHKENSVILDSKNIVKENLNVHNKEVANIPLKKRIKKISDLPIDSLGIFFFGSGTYLYFDSLAHYTFNMNQCSYSFPISVRDDKIEILWGLNNPNCSYDRRLTEKYGLIKYPIEGTKFAEVKIQNDSTIITKYFYEEWVQKANEQMYNVEPPFNSKRAEHDTLFPKLFFIAQ